jgi:hypothetical protein
MASSADHQAILATLRSLLRGTTGNGTPIPPPPSQKVKEAFEAALSLASLIPSHDDPLAARLVETLLLPSLHGTVSTTPHNVLAADLAA